MARQKSLDSYGKREHLRLWQKGAVEGRQAWLGAYTRETSATLSLKYHKFIHHIDHNLEEGVLMLIRDLFLTGCIQSVRRLTRSQLAQTMVNATGDEMHTDGALSVVVEAIAHSRRPNSRVNVEAILLRDQSTKFIALVRQN